MAQYGSYADNLTLEEQIKSLEDEELLDFWEETQYLSKLPSDELPEELEYHPDCERLILQELQVRSCRKIGG